MDGFSFVHFLKSRVLCFFLQKIVWTCFVNQMLGDHGNCVEMVSVGDANDAIDLTLLS